MFSKKAAIIDKIFTIDLTCSRRQIDNEDFVNLEAFLENMNFDSVPVFYSRIVQIGWRADIWLTNLVKFVQFFKGKKTTNRLLHLW